MTEQQINDKIAKFLNPKHESCTNKYCSTKEVKYTRSVDACLTVIDKLEYSFVITYAPKAVSSQIGEFKTYVIKDNYAHKYKQDNLDKPFLTHPIWEESLSMGLSKAFVDLIDQM